MKISITNELYARLRAHFTEQQRTTRTVVFTSDGRAVREWIEASTNAQQQPVLDAIGRDYDELLGYLEPWASAIVAASYYPSDIRQLPPAWGQLPDLDAKRSAIGR